MAFRDMSPRKYAAVVASERGLDMYGLTEIYERARYAESLIRSEDVKNMQQLCRQARLELNRN